MEDEDQNTQIPLNITNSDLELPTINEDNEQICRICLESDYPEEFISPCVCSGTQKYVHKHCLNTWRYQDVDSENFYRCNECRTEFIIRNKKSSLLARFCKKIFFILNEYFSILVILNFALNSILGIVIDTILYKLKYGSLAENFYVTGTFINTSLQIIYLLILCIALPCNRYFQNILNNMEIRIKPSSILTINILNFCMFFFNYFIALITNFFIIKQLYTLIYHLHLKNRFIADDEILDYDSHSTDETRQLLSV
ncbi:RING-variant domain [seawater metagenome]|uniref:RING-variant domain n=1 Tax=seawater metagenome TaxID=1561972 RepID=A0A5E8CKK3_9ZZZZ